MSSFDVKNKLFKENIPKIKEILYNKNVEIFCLPTLKLRELIAKGEHPIANKLGSNIKSIFLEGKGILIQKRLVLEWIEGRLDENHKFIFENSELRIREDGNILLKGDK
jgi:hypothetical protein